MKSALYGHLDSFNVAVGQIIKKGDILGLMGNTGHSNGAHLHITIFDKKLTFIPWMAENPGQKASKALTEAFVKKPGIFLDPKTKKVRGIKTTTAWLGYANHYALDIISGADGWPYIAWNQDEDAVVGLRQDFGNLRFGKTLVLHYPYENYKLGTVNYASVRLRDKPDLKTGKHLKWVYKGDKVRLLKMVRDEYMVPWWDTGEGYIHGAMVDVD